MVIESFTESDAGKYKCEATGVGGTRDSRVTFVKMEGTVEICIVLNTSVSWYSWICLLFIQYMYFGEPQDKMLHEYCYV